MTTYPSVPPRMIVVSSSTASPGPRAQDQRSRSAARAGCDRSGAGIEVAVPSAVAEIEDQPDREPDDQPQPVGPPKPVNHGAAHDNAERRHHRQRRNGEAARELGPPPPQDPDAGTHQDEGE